MSATYKLIYASQAHDKICYADLDSILAKSRKNNAFYEVSGILIFSDGYFIQLLEADSVDTVRATLSRIIKDPRHHTVRILREWNCTERSLQQSSMAFLDHDVHGESFQFIKKLFNDSMMISLPSNTEFVNFFKDFMKSNPALK